MAIRKNHYEVLGVSPSASVEDIRTAFRSLARRYHPDLADEVSASQRMADINEAWTVLSDPTKRRDFDLSIRPEELISASRQPEVRDHSDVQRQTYVQPARFPWRGILFFGVVAIMAVLFMHAVAKPTSPEIPDNLLVNGSCIEIDTERFVREVSCQNPHDGVVRQLVAYDRDCPSDTMGYLDRQGMGIACIDSSLATDKWETQGP